MRGDRSPTWYADVPSRAAAAPPPRGPGRGSCTAVCADTGRQCRLPAHAGDGHAHERGRFTRVAAPGQTIFPARAALEVAAFARPGDAMERGAPGPAREKARPRKLLTDVIADVRAAHG
jgi:hypothetical protein